MGTASLIFQEIIMVHIIYICIITFLIGAYVARVRHTKSLKEELAETFAAGEEGMDFHYNRSEHWRLKYEEENQKDSVEAYNALEQGLQEVQDAYATDMAQYEATIDNLRTILIAKADLMFDEVRGTLQSSQVPELLARIATQRGTIEVAFQKIAVLEEERANALAAIDLLSAEMTRIDMEMAENEK